jgi:uncharacterized DUF497 family protein
MHIIAQLIEFDPAKDKRNRLLHGVSFGDAETALRDPLALTREDPDARGERVRIISARKASRGETEQYNAKAL